MDDRKKRAKARQHALADLGKRYRDEYQGLYRFHLSEMGLSAAPQETADEVVAVMIEPADGKVPCRCGHTRRFHDPGCRVCPCQEFRAR